MNIIQPIYNGEGFSGFYGFYSGVSVENSVFFTDYYGYSFYVLISCTNDSICDDGLFCNGPEVCQNGWCTQTLTNPCNSPCSSLTYCSEQTRTCFDPVNTTCNDGIFCNGNDMCDEYGHCSIHSGDPCTGGPVCNNYCTNSSSSCNSPSSISCSYSDTCESYCYIGACLPCNNRSSVVNNITNNPKSSSAVPAGVIIGPIVGVLGLLGIAGTLFFLYKRYRKVLPTLQDFKNIVIIDRLGGGQFGEVYRGIMDVRSFEKTLNSLRTRFQLQWRS